ncbi:MAG: MATE family efflux transporter, partial [Pseudomonadota bacterium]
TASISTFGDSAVSGWTVIGRIIPVAFGSIFALSGSVGPIIGQNFGAKNRDRMSEALTKSIYVSIAFTGFAWILLALTADFIVDQLATSQEAADLIRLFCYWLAPLFAFLGILFVSNAAFNTLGRPYYSTGLNWGRATIGTIPFVLLGGHLAQAPGVLAANMMGGVLFGGLGALLAYRLVDSLAASWPATPPPVAPRRDPDTLCQEKAFGSGNID